ncbi:hypothetical protein BBN63_07895 [Streptomyces niveus]|uniref:Uncharacterized protein n=1 Tax=Streptomyces niveus TaxID=193462 RepID=A0A1U9QPJ3_STRNV|nr:hypothetical protein BBN63_07895 [Streptomyces niveus]
MHHTSTRRAERRGARVVNAGVESPVGTNDGERLGARPTGRSFAGGTTALPSAVPNGTGIVGADFRLRSTTTGPVGPVGSS